MGFYMKINKNLYENYISIVAVISNDADIILEKVRRMDDVLRNHFKYYEYIFVDNHSTDNSLDVLKCLDIKCTIIALSKKHKLAQAVTAGIDAAIGDYIFEIEDLRVNIDFSLFMEMYDTCQKGNDFVFLTPRTSGKGSKLFYRLLNQRLRLGGVHELAASSVCTLSSRRGQNKVSATGDYIVNQNVSYVLAGLGCARVEADIVYKNRRGVLSNLNLTIESFIYYTDAVLHLLSITALAFLGISVCMGIYSMLSYMFEDITPGWTSTIMFISFGFSGIFAILAVISKYLDHILKNTTHAKQYIFSDMIKK